MVETVAIVISRAGTSVEVEARPPACPRCEAGQGCGAGLFSDRAPRRFQATLPAGIDVSPGDGVTVAFGGRALTSAALFSYGLPLAGLVLGAAVAGTTGLGDTAAMLAAAGGLAAGAVAGRLLAGRTGCAGVFEPVVLRRAAPPENDATGSRASWS